MMMPIHLVAAGARTPAGLHAASAAAAVRAGLSVVGRHPYLVDQVGDPMPIALDGQLDPALIGPDRLLALANTALLEACEPLSGAAKPFGGPLPVYLGLPEIRPGFSPDDAEAVRAGLGRIRELPIPLGPVVTFPMGHSAALIAAAAAARSLRLGEHHACLIGGVDSYCHPDTMEWLDQNRQLVGSVSRSGFVPGEGAGFCLLMTQAACSKWGLSGWMCLRATSVGRETKLIKTTEMCLGEGLSATVSEAARSLGPAEKINQVICDINGERYRGEEWGFVCLRLARHFDDPTAYHSPADSWGDVGAASGTLFAMLTCQAAARGYAHGPRTLLWTSSEQGQRAALLLEQVGTAP